MKNDKNTPPQPQKPMERDRPHYSAALHKLKRDGVITKKMFDEMKHFNRERLDLCLQMISEIKGELFDIDYDDIIAKSLRLYRAQQSSSQQQR